MDAGHDAGLDAGRDAAVDAGPIPCTTSAVCPANEVCCTDAGPTPSFCIAECSDGIKDGNETDVDCGGSCPGCADTRACNTGADCAGGTCSSNVCVTPGLLLLASGGSGTTGAMFISATQKWIVQTTYPSTQCASVALTRLSNGGGVGLCNNGTNVILGTEYPGIGTNWTSALTVGESAKSPPGGVPAMTSFGTTAYAALLNAPGVPMFGVESGGVWNWTNVSASGATYESDLALTWAPETDAGTYVGAWIDATGVLRIPSSNGSWGNPDVQGSAANPAYSPSLSTVGTGGSAAALVAYTDNADGGNNIWYSPESSSQNWHVVMIATSPAAASGPVLGPTPAGTMLVYLAQDTTLHYAVYSGASWSPISPVFPLLDGGASVPVSGRPSLAIGTGANVLAEMAYASNGAIFHTRYTTNVGTGLSAWSTPVQVTPAGGSYSTVAIASGP